MRKFVTILFSLAIASPGMILAQQGSREVRKGNSNYKKQKFAESIPLYQKALEQDPNNPKANYNLGNAQFRNQDMDEAVQSFDKAFNTSAEVPLRERAVYNKGVVFSKQKKLMESIDAYKTALKLDPADEDARVNLQKALLELKKNQSNQQQQQDQKQQQQQKKQQQQQKPKEQQSKFNKRQVENLMKALRQKEQEIQQKMQQNKARSTTQSDKDW